MKKYLAIILSILLIGSLAGCSGGTETKKKKAKESTENVLDSKNDEARMVEIGITYEKGLFVSSNEKTEISIYMDGINVGKMNADEKKIFVACLAPGKHKVKVKRTEDDEDSYEFEVEKDDGQSVVSKISIGLRYKISGLRGKTELKEFDFPEDVESKNYVWLTEDIDRYVKDSGEEIVDLTDVVKENITDIRALLAALNRINISMTLTKGGGYYVSEDGSITITNYVLSKPVLILTHAASIYGVNCYMKWDKVSKILSEKGEYIEKYSTKDEEIFIIDNIEVTVTHEGENLVQINVGEYTGNNSSSENIDKENEEQDSTTDNNSLSETDSENASNNENSDENSSEYILPDSSDRYLSADDVKGLTKDQIKLAINEIYAKHGRIFTDSYYNNYFSSKSWYEGSVSADDFDESVLNEYEKANIDLLAQMR